MAKKKITPVPDDQQYMCPHCLEIIASQTCEKCGHTAYPYHPDPLLDQFKDSLRNIIDNINKNHVTVLDPNDMIDNHGAIEELIDRKMQVQPAGVDLTVQKISALDPGIGLEIDFTNEHRKLPAMTEIFSSGDNDFVVREDGKKEFETDDGIILNASPEFMKKASEKSKEKLDYGYLHNNYHMYPDNPWIAPYLVTYHEKVIVPPNAIGIVFHRSTLMRGFSSLFSAIWEPGYSGYGTGIIYVPRNTIIHKFSRVGQIVFLSVNAKEVYDGVYNKEGIVDKEKVE